MKKRGFGEGRWNGFGGKVMENETIEEATKRELLEETGIEVGNMEKVGIIEFNYDFDTKVHEVHIFKINDYFGEIKESEEMKPQWFFVDEIPFKEMFPDDLYWMPLFLKGKKFKGKFTFNDINTIIDKDLKVVRQLE